MTRRTLGWIAAWLALIGPAPAPAFAADDGPLALTDLAAYRRALEPTPGAAGPAPRVDFAALWKAPKTWAGRRVAVAGRVARAFTQPAVGSFPPLTETWIAGPAGDPICLVAPARDGAPRPRVGDSVAFTGTFLRPIRYRGGDVDRLAPWLVGPEPPAPAPAEPAPPAGSPARDGRVDVAVGVAAGAAVLAMLARRHLARPAVRRPAEADPAPRFLDGAGDDVAPGPPRFCDGDDREEATP